MKKNIIVFITVLILILSIIYVNINIVQKKKLEVDAFNKGFTSYNKSNLMGVEVITLINKAISNNEKYGVKRDENGFYIDDENKIEIIVIFNEKSYQMERIDAVGIESFIEYFGSVNFECTSVKYHESGKISEMTFLAKNF